MSVPLAAIMTGARSPRRRPERAPRDGAAVFTKREAQLTGSLTVSIDAMGGDTGPGIVVTALARSAVRHPGVRFLLHGDEAVLKPLFAKRAKLLERVEIRHSAERVRMEEKPSQALRRGRNTSMWRAIESVKNKEAQVAISAGNTGALMAMSMFQLGVLDGIHRPAIAALWPTKRGQSVVLDVGANIECDAEQLVDFAVMGEAFARAILGLERPSLGILNVGAEDMKGHDAVKGAAQILRTATLPIEFRGFVEGDDIAEGTTDVIVTDGFTGNIALKTAEGTAKLVVYFLRSALRRSLLGRIGGFFATGALGVLRRKLDPRASNGGIFLGLNGVVVKSHGGTDALGFASALDMAIDMARADVISGIVADRASIAPPVAPAASGAAVS
jgi:glycerol-3-phosphate acyltransferase PlsX